MIAERYWSSRSFIAAAGLLSLLGMSLLGMSREARGQEVQVSFDPAGQVDVIDADLRRELDLFPEVNGFREARLFRVAEGAYELVVRYEEGGQVLRERRALTTTEAEALRERVRQGLAARGARLRDRRALEDGRYRFLASTTLLGAYEGALLATAAVGLDEAEDGETIPAAFLLGGTAGFFVPLLLTREGDVTEAEGILTGYGGLVGFSHGLALSVLANGGDLGRGTALVAAVTGAAEATGGFLLARRQALRGGVAESAVISGLFGTGIGLFSAALIDNESDIEDVPRLYALSGLAGSSLGTYGGYRLGQSFDYSQGDARIFGTSGLIGLQVAQTVAYVIRGDDFSVTRSVSVASIAGSVGGLWLGHRLVRDREFSEGQGNIVVLGALVGTFAGNALTILVDGNGPTASVLGTLGSLGGFLGAYYSYRNEAQPEGASRLDLDLGMGLGRSMEGGAGGPWGDLTPSLNLQLTF